MVRPHTCLLALVTLTLTCIAGCPTGNDDPNNTASTTAAVAIQMQADFTATAGKTAPRMQSAGCDPTDPVDEPGIAAGNDCDGDGGVVRYVTPTAFRVAVKQLTMYADDGAAVNIVNHATLADAEVVDLTTPVQFSKNDVPVGSYTSLEAQFYYYELTMPLNDAGTTQRIRVYLSDDNFPGEGSLGHHQGDITLVDDTGTELGFVQSGQPWTAADVQPTRGSIEGTAGTDPETGHARGLYGDADFWNDATLMQGASQDIYTLTPTIDVDLTTAGQTIRVVFNVANSWFYEDFNGDEVFGPCGTQSAPSDEACADGSAWSPILPIPELETQ